MYLDIKWPTYLLVVGEFDGLDLLRAVLVVVEVVFDGERLHQLHRRLRSNLGHAVEKQDVLLCVLCVVEVVGVELEYKMIIIIHQIIIATNGA